MLEMARNRVDPAEGVEVNALGYAISADIYEYRVPHSYFVLSVRYLKACGLIGFAMRLIHIGVDPQTHRAIRHTGLVLAGLLRDELRALGLVPRSFEAYPAVTPAEVNADDAVAEEGRPQSSDSSDSDTESSRASDGAAPVAADAPVVEAGDSDSSSEAGDRDAPPARRARVLAAPGRGRGGRGGAAAPAAAAAGAAAPAPVSAAFIAVSDGRPTDNVGSAAVRIVGCRCLRWWCTCHRSHLVLRSFFRVPHFSEMLKRAREIVKYFRKHGQAAAELASRLRAAHARDEEWKMFSLVADITPRWLSTWGSLSRIEALWECVYEVLYTRSLDMSLTAKDRRLCGAHMGHMTLGLRLCLQTVMQVIQPLVDVLQDFQTDLCIGGQWPRQLAALRAHLTRCALIRDGDDADADLAQAPFRPNHPDTVDDLLDSADAPTQVQLGRITWLAGRVLLRLWRRYFGTGPSTLELAVVHLDIRTRHVGFNLVDAAADDASRDARRDACRVLWTSLFGPRLGDAAGAGAGTGAAAAGGAPIPVPPHAPVRRGGFGRELSRNAAGAAPNAAARPAGIDDEFIVYDQELSYVEPDIFTLRASHELLRWWADQGRRQRMPRLSQLAITLLLHLPSSAVVERGGSLIKKLLSGGRCSTLPARVIQDIPRLFERRWRERLEREGLVPRAPAPRVVVRRRRARPAAAAADAPPGAAGAAGAGPVDPEPAGPAP
jgi:hypothetical protein